MTFALLTRDAICTVATGAVSYVFCRAFNQSHPLEKAALVAIMVGLRELSATAIHFKIPKDSNLRTCLIFSSKLAVIPCALYAGWMLDFKAADYLKIAGLTYIGDNVYQILNSLYDSYQSSKLV